MAKVPTPRSKSVTESEENAPQYDSIQSLLTRVYWMALGPSILALLLLAIAQDTSGRFIASDAIYLGFLVLLPICRWLEFRAGNARSAQGDTVTKTNLLRYAAAAAVIGVLAWLVAKGVGTYFISK